MEIKKETRYTEVDLTGEDFVLIDGGDILAIGDLDLIKSRMEESLQNGASIDDFKIGQLKTLEAEIDAERTISLPRGYIDEEYSINEEEYVIEVKNHLYTTTDDLDHALDIIAELLQEESSLDLEDDVTLIRKVEYECNFQAEAEYKVNIDFSLQPVEVEVRVETQQPNYESMSVDDLMKLRSELNNLITRKLQKEEQPVAPVEKIDDDFF